MWRMVPVMVLAAALAGCSGGLPSGREGDVAFAQQMIPHHQQALEMAEIALTKDTSSALADLAREIRREQDPEIVLMRAWLAEWGAEELPHAGAGEQGASADDGHEHGMAGMATSEQLRSLAEGEGADFERMWLELMVAHHEGAVAMAEQVSESTEDPEVRALAEAVRAGQTEGIDRMTGVLER